MIFLVRHGEATAGWGDAPDPGLSELGFRQAEAAAALLKEAGATAAISSPMQRCRDTASAFETLMGVTAPVEPAVSEIITPSDVGDRVAWLRGVMSGRWDENADDFMAWRTAARDAVAALPDETVVFSHFVAINAIVGLLDDDPDVVVFRPGHCSITRLCRKDGELFVAERGSEAATKVL